MTSRKETIMENYNSYKFTFIKLNALTIRADTQRPYVEVMKELDALTGKEQETLMAYLEEVDENIDYGIRMVKSGDAYLTGCKTLEEEAEQLVEEVTTVEWIKKYIDIYQLAYALSYQNYYETDWGGGVLFVG